MSANTWTVAEAKAKFSEVILKASRDGPQTITKSGRSAVIATAEEWERKTHRRGYLADFFAASPLRESGLEMNRIQDGSRIDGL